MTGDCDQRTTKKLFRSKAESNEKAAMCRTDMFFAKIMTAPCTPYLLNDSGVVRAVPAFTVS